MYASSENKNFSLNNVTDRLNKIMDNLLEDFQNHFSVLQIGLIFPKLIFCEEYWARRPTFKDRSEMSVTLTPLLMSLGNKVY